MRKLGLKNVQEIRSYGCVDGAVGLRYSDFSGNPWVTGMAFLVKCYFKV